MAADFANVGAVHMDADGGLVGQGVPHAVHVANVGRHGFDMAGLQAGLFGRGEPAAPCISGKGLAQFGAAQHADQAPHGVVMDGGGLAGAPHKADHRKTVIRIGVQQVLLVTLGVGLSVVLRQPIVVGYQFGQQGFATLQNRRFVWGAL